VRWLETPGPHRAIDLATTAEFAAEIRAVMAEYGLD
jgi:hypothetical protein